MVDSGKSGNSVLTPKQARFVEEYLVDLNATRAAIRAGYEFKDAGDSHYTYMLCDPRTGAAFYIGKGKGARVGKHVRNAISGKIDNAQKHKKIKEVIESGHEVLGIIFSSHEKAMHAYAVERELIERLKDFGLTNIVGGLVTNEELVQIQAKHALDSLIPYEIWLSKAKPYQVMAAEKLFGSAKACHEAIRNELQVLATTC